MPPSPPPPPHTPSAHDLPSSSSSSSQPSASQPIPSSVNPIPSSSPSIPPIAPNPSPAVVEGSPSPAAPPPPPPHPFPPGTFYISFPFPFPIPASAPNPLSPAGAPPNGEEARARFFEVLRRAGVSIPGGGAQSATNQPSPPANENGGGAPLGGEDQAMQNMLEEEMRRTFGAGEAAPPSPQAQAEAPAQQPLDSSSNLSGSPNPPPPNPPVRSSNFPFAGLAPMNFNFPPASGGIMNHLAAMLGAGRGGGLAQPPVVPLGSPQPAADGAAAAAPPPPAGAGVGGGMGVGAMSPELLAHMQGFFPGFSVIPSPGDGPAPPLPSSPPSTGANALPNAPPPPPNTDGAPQPNPQANANPFLQSLIDRVLSQIVIPSDPNAPPPDPNAPPSNGSIFITLHFGGPPPQEDKEPDPERAKELLSALEKPERGLVERLDRGLRLEEKEAGVEVGERTGARCSVCLDSLLDADEDESEKGKEKEERDDVAMAEEKEGQEVLSLPCSHAFHRGCLGPWLEMHTNCPTCRFDLDPLSTTLRPNRTATTLPSRTSTPTPLNPTPNGSSSSTSTTNNRAHPYSRPSTRPSTPQPPQPAVPSSSTAPTTASSAPTNDRPYTPPPARLTLLSRVLSLESSHHLRCSLPLCTHAPSSSHPKGYPTKSKMFSLVRAEGELAPETFGAERKRWVLNGCEHIFHPTCLRIAEGIHLDGSDGVGEWEGGRRKVWCPVRGCKGVGWVKKEDWEAEEEEEEPEEEEVERATKKAHEKTDVAPMDLDGPTSAPTASTSTTTTPLEPDVDVELD